MVLGENEWVIGVMFAMGAACSNNLGLNLQKLVHIHVQRVEAERLADGGGGGDDEEAGGGLKGSVELGAASSRPGSPAASPASPVSPASPRSAADYEDDEQRALARRRGSGASGGLPSSSPRVPSIRAVPLDEAPAASSSTAAAASPGAAASPPPPPEAEWKPAPWVTAIADALVLVKRSGPPRSYYLQPLWLIGFFFQVLGALCDFAALAFAAQSLVAPLGAMTLVVNIYLAPFFSGEKLSRRDVLSTVTIIAGAAVAVLFASHEEEERTPEEMFAYFTSVRFVIYGTFIATTVLFLASIIRFVDRIRTKMAVARMPAVISAREELKSVLRFLYGAMAGISGAQSLMFAKAASTLVRFGFPGMFTHYQTYLILGALVFTLYLQIRFLNEALQRFDALVIVPIFEAFWIGGGVVAGLVVYEESDAYSLVQAALFATGIVITLAGVYSLSINRESSANERRGSRLLLHRQSVNGGDAAAAAAAAAAEEAACAGADGGPGKLGSPVAPGTSGGADDAAARVSTESDSSS